MSAGLRYKQVSWFMCSFRSTHQQKFARSLANRRKTLTHFNRCERKTNIYPQTVGDSSHTELPRQPVICVGKTQGDRAVKVWVHMRSHFRCTWTSGGEIYLKIDEKLKEGRKEITRLKTEEIALYKLCPAVMEAKWGNTCSFVCL